METYEELLDRFLKSHEIWGWGDLVSRGYNVLHFAKSHDLEFIKKFIKMGVDVNAKTVYDVTPVMEACRGGHIRNLEYFISIGANLDVPDIFIDLLHFATCQGKNGGTVRVLIRNGFRINKLERYLNYASWKELNDIQNATLRCRSAVIAILTLKKRAKAKFINLDKFVLREIAFAIWATRKVEAKWL